MMNQVNIDISKISSLEDFHDEVTQALRFPSYYGRNKDAFWDCLSDYADDVEVTLVGVTSLKAELKKALSDYLAMLKEHADKNPESFKLIRR
jgi:ribonuclease inhibitor